MIGVIDFGGQYAHLIANRIRRLGVYAEVLLSETSLADLKKYKGIILSGGPQSVYAPGAPQIDRRLFSLGIPVLGLCYGHQLIAYTLGGKVSSGQVKEYGLAALHVERREGIFKNIPRQTRVWMSHGDEVAALPRGFVRLAATDDCKNAAMGDLQRRIFSAQFHMEVTHTSQGMVMLRNFVEMCREKRDWNMEKFLKKEIDEVRARLKGRKVFLLASGGVDSTVAYVLLAKSLGPEHVYGLFVDTGLLRKNEGKNIAAAFKKIGIQNFHRVASGDRFLGALRGVTEPEEKRKIIGDMFLKVQAEAVRSLKLNPGDWVLGQGTIYPDTIESAGTRHADRIKTHHNRVPEIVELVRQGKVVEPLAQLYKDEVRHLGTSLGLPEEMVWKHPFPGPGLAVRILCAKKENWPPHKNSIEEEINRFLASHEFSGTILPLQSVGVQGDSRTYRHPLVIRPLAHTAINFHRLEKLSTALTNRFSAINRVLLLLSPAAVTHCKVRSSFLTKNRIQLLQDLDDTVMNFVMKNGMERKIWQFPTVLLPVFINESRKESVVLRPVCSEEAMTANFFKMPLPTLEMLTRKLSPRVSAVFYDITNKPPGTIEWE